MARARNIKPGFFTNDALAEACPLARILFAGLWCFADREGRLFDRPKKIKAEILPYDDCSADELLESLAALGFIVRYEVSGTRYIQVVNFYKHQNPHVKEQASEIPAPDLHQTCTSQQQVNTDESTEVAGLIPSSLIPDSLIPIEKPPAPPIGFAEFWNAYPKKKSKGAAEKVWKRIKPDLQTVLSAIERAKTSADWLKEQGQFIPYPASWLNAKGWEDEIVPVVAASGKPWFLSSTGIEQEAARRGIQKHEGEMFPFFKQRVFQAAGVTDEMVRNAQADRVAA